MYERVHFLPTPKLTNLEIGEVFAQSQLSLTTTKKMIMIPRFGPTIHITRKLTDRPK